MGEAESRALVIIGVNPYLAPETLDDVSAYRESESRALCVFVDFLEPVEHLLALVGGYAASRVGDGKVGHVVLCGEREGD